MTRRQAEGRPVPAEVELYLKQLTASAIEAGDVIDLFKEAGLDQPDLSHLDESYIKKMQPAKHPAIVIEALRRLVQQEMRKYTNQNLTAVEIIAELVAVAKEVAADANRGQQFNPALSNDELAFYDAVAAKDTVRELVGDDQLAAIARDLVKAVHRNLSTDWTARDDVQAKLRSIIKRLLAKHGYPPEEQPDAIQKVIEQTRNLRRRVAPAADADQATEIRTEPHRAEDVMSGR